MQLLPTSLPFYILAWQLLSFALPPSAAGEIKRTETDTRHRILLLPLPSPFSPFLFFFRHRLPTSVVLAFLTEASLLSPMASALICGAVVLAWMLLASALRTKGVQSSSAGPDLVSTAKLETDGGSKTAGARSPGGDEDSPDFFGFLDPNTLGFIFSAKPLIVSMLESLFSAVLWACFLLVMRPGQLQPFFG